MNTREKIKGVFWILTYVCLSLGITLTSVYILCTSIEPYSIPYYIVVILGWLIILCKVYSWLKGRKVMNDAIEKR